MGFNKETEFENALINLLFEKGWDRTVLLHKTEKELLQNWADILFDNNRGVDRLNDSPLTAGEMQQIIEQITMLRTPLMLNGFINGKTIQIKRDNPNDILHKDKEVSLKIYDRQEIAAGQSRYQIAEQPVFPTKSKMLNDRRGDLMLLINGMPVIHIELKKSGVPISQAYNQIEKYSHEGVFTGLFSLIQIFVAMTPEETVYFANPGVDGKFNKDYYFHWADFNNEPINDWQDIATYFLSIPMAHQLIGFYTVADNTDGILKVMRSYQYYAASAISDKVAKTKWEEKDQYGGYVWHTTGSGKTMTSFKSAQLISSSKDADKVVFLVDRIELGTQSLGEYKGFADDSETVQSTENTNVLITKLKSPDPAATLIVTSIQKMSNIKEDGTINDRDIAIINAKRLVFIVDECHRSTFGDMLTAIKNTFPTAIFFGFTGTPIQDENMKNKSTTASVFGDGLHRYSIADGIRDKNVLGFDPYMVRTYSDNSLRNAVALSQAKAKSVEEALKDPKKTEIYYRFMDNNQISMAGEIDNNGKYIKGIEDYLPKSQYSTDKHRNAVVDDILCNWTVLSRNKKFHAILAVNSIDDAIAYYRLFKTKNTDLHIAALFDQNIDNNEGACIKEDAIAEMLTDYNAQFGQNFTIPTYARYKKDVSYRLAHKQPYWSIDNQPEQLLDLLIVVDQMLTGFDSKWLNTLYLDKILRFEGIIQAFSRTNRLFSPYEKPFGTIKYYRKPYTMQKNIEKAVKLYSGDKPLALFVDHLDENLANVNRVFEDIREIFQSEEIVNFEKLPADNAAKAKFASLFRELNEYLEAAKIQGFVWNKKQNKPLIFDETTFLTLLQRYKELSSPDPVNQSETDVPFDIDTYISEISTGAIDAEYMNTRFKKYLKSLNSGASQEVLEEALGELHTSFASLTQEEQKYANIFLHDVEKGDASLIDGKCLHEYITDYQVNAKNSIINRFCENFGVDENQLRTIMKLHVSEQSINEFGRFDALVATVNKEKAREYFERGNDTNIPTYKLAIKTDAILRKFILSGGECNF